MPRKRAFRHGFSRLAKHDRNAIQVHYLPARREPADHISYSANALLGRALRAADWAAEREEIADLTDKISSALVGNGAIGGITSALAAQWRKLHKGAYFADPSISFARSELENLLRRDVDVAGHDGENARPRVSQIGALRGIPSTNMVRLFAM